MPLVDLAIGVSTDDVDVSGFRDVDVAAAAASSAVSDLGNDAATSARKLGISADAADELAGKAGKTTGALGALSAGFELVGLEKYAEGLQSAAMATDFVSGAGDAYNLVMESTAVKTVAAKAATIANTVATGAQTVATTAMTAAQTAFNAVMTANPIALVVLAIAALVAGLILAYKKSETFRGIVKDVGEVGKAAIGFVVDKGKDLADLAGKVLPAAFDTGKNLIVGYLKLVTLPIRTLVDVGMEVVDVAKNDIPNAFGSAADKAKEIGSAITKPFRDVIDLVDDLIDKVKNIKIPDLPDINPFNRATAGAFDGTGLAGLGTSSQPAYIDQRQFTVNGVVDVVGAARQLRDLMDRADRIFAPVAP